MLIIDPDYPHIVLSFTYRGFKIEIDQGKFEGRQSYAAWANYANGCAVAVPFARTRPEAVRKAKRWVDGRLRVGIRK